MLSVVEASDWTSYNKSGMSFIYPSEWGSRESWAGTVLGDNQTFAISITMHREGCYPLSQHPQLMDLMLKMWGGQMQGTPDGDPITQFYENEIGPYSTATQIYKNPDQALICEMQGYSAKNVTATFVLANWKPEDPQWSQNVLKLAKLRASFKVTIFDTKTIQVSEKAFEINPQYAASWFEKGNSLYDQNKFNESIQAYEKAIELNPQLAEAWYNKGKALSNPDEAIKAYDKAIEIDPHLAVAWIHKGFALALQDKYNESLQAFDKAIELDPNLALAWGGRGGSLKALGRTSEADAAFAKSKELLVKS